MYQIPSNNNFIYTILPYIHSVIHIRTPFFPSITEPNYPLTGKTQAGCNPQPTRTVHDVVVPEESINQMIGEAVELPKRHC